MNTPMSSLEIKSNKSLENIKIQKTQKNKNRQSFYKCAFSSTTKMESRGECQWQT